MYDCGLKIIFHKVTIYDISAILLPTSSCKAKNIGLTTFHTIISYVYIVLQHSSEGFQEFHLQKQECFYKT